MNMGYLNPCEEAFLLTLPLEEGTVVRFSKLVQQQGCLLWTVTRMQGGASSLEESYGEPIQVC